MKKVIFVTISAVMFAANISSAREYSGLGPISLRNQNPVYLQFLSLTPQRAAVLPEGIIELRIDSAYSNLYEYGVNGTTNLDLDMELWRISPHILYGIAEDMELGVEIPLLHFNGGFLDGFIQKFHKAFGLPNGGRGNVPDGRFSYAFTYNGTQVFNYPEANLGLGDISVSFKNQLTGEDSDFPAMSWFAEIKFPTGRKSRGFGSGTPDFGFGYLLETSWKRLHGYLNAGLYALGGNDDMDAYMYTQMAAYSIAGELTIIPACSFLIQLNGSTPLFTKAHIGDWEGTPLDFIVGFRGELQKLIGTHDFIWQIGFSEDITSEGPSVDFTVFASVGVRFDLFGRTRPAGDWQAKR